MLELFNPMVVMLTDCVLFMTFSKRGNIGIHGTIHLFIDLYGEFTISTPCGDVPEIIGRIIECECMEMRKELEEYLAQQMPLARQTRQKVDFQYLLAGFVVAIRATRPNKIREVFCTNKETLACVLKGITNDRSRRYSFAQKTSAAILLTRLRDTDCEKVIVKFYEKCDSVDREKIKHLLLEELVDSQYDDITNEPIVCKQILGCLAFDDVKSIREMVEVLISCGYQRLIEEENPRLLRDIDLEELARENARSAMPAPRDILRLYLPGPMLPPPSPMSVVEKLRSWTRFFKKY